MRLPNFVSTFFSESRIIERKISSCQQEMEKLLLTNCKSVCIHEETVKAYDIPLEYSK